MSLTSPYVSNVPQGNQQINTTQQPIKNNFQDIYDYVSINHVPFNTANDFGKHNYVSYYNQAAIPGASTNQMVFFSQQTTNEFGLFYQYPNSTIVNQLVSNLPTNSGTVPGGNGSGSLNIVSFASSGYQYLTGPILMMFGIISLVTPNNSVVASSTQIFSFGYWGQPVSFTNKPFYIEALPVNISTYGVPATSYPRSSGLVEVVIIDNLTFSITIQNSTSGLFQILVIGI